MKTAKSFLKTLLPGRVVLHLQALDHYLNGEEELRLISRLCPQGRDAIDAGANIGTYSYFLRKYARRVYAYEPNPNLAIRLSRLLPDVTVRNLALSNKSGPVTLKVPVDAHGNAEHELASVSQDFGSKALEFQVNAITIDSENLSDVGFLKVDVEQHEREVLQGAIKTIQRCRPVILTEVTPLKYERDLREVFAFITENNYIGWFRFDRGWFPLDSFRNAVHANAQHFGSKAFVGNNLIFFPAEHVLARAGPRPE